MGFHNFFPSKLFLTITLSLLGIGLLAGLFFLYRNDQEDTSSGMQIEQVSQNLRQYALENDQDKDSLPDWAENLWHTDPNNPDTDGDGTKDGNEVTQGRNPAVAGPNDFLDHIDTADQTVSGTSTTASSTDSTTIVARELFGSYLLLKQTGKFDAAAQTRLIEALSQSTTNQLNLRPYEISNLNIVPATPTSIATYGDRMTDIFTKFAAISKTRPNELMLLKQVLETKDYSQLSSIISSAPVYSDLSAQLRAVPTPQDIASQQLTLANAYQVYAEMDKALGNIQHDPVKAIVYIGQYQKVEATGQKAMGDIITYLGAHAKK